MNPSSVCFAAAGSIEVNLLTNDMLIAGIVIPTQRPVALLMNLQRQNIQACGSG